MIKKILKNQAVRYVFWGGCTTLVNLVMYFILTRFTPLNMTLSNALAVFISILFAYVVNKLFVFEHKTHSMGELVKEACGFIGMRGGTMVLDVAGVALMSFMGMNDLVAKFLIQFIVLVINYVISKFFVFKDKKEHKI